MIDLVYYLHLSLPLQLPLPQTKLPVLLSVSRPCTQSPVLPGPEETQRKEKGGQSNRMSQATESVCSDLAVP